MFQYKKYKTWVRGFILAGFLFYSLSAQANPQAAGPVWHFLDSNRDGVVGLEHHAVDHATSDANGCPVGHPDGEIVTAHYTVIGLDTGIEIDQEVAVPEPGPDIFVFDDISGMILGTGFNCGVKILVSDIDASDNESDRAFIEFNSCNDVNGDGSFDLSDIIALLGNLFLGADVRCGSQLDANGDNSSDISDARFMLDLLFSGQANGGNECQIVTAGYEKLNGDHLPGDPTGTGSEACPVTDDAAEGEENMPGMGAALDGIIAPLLQEEEIQTAPSPTPTPKPEDHLPVTNMIDTEYDDSKESEPERADL